MTICLEHCTRVREEVGGPRVKAEAEEGAEASRYQAGRSLDSIPKIRISGHYDLGKYFPYLTKRERDPCLEGSRAHLASASAVWYSLWALRLRLTLNQVDRTGSPSSAGGGPARSGVSTSASSRR